MCLRNYQMKKEKKTWHWRRSLIISNWSIQLPTQYLSPPPQIKSNRFSEQMYVISEWEQVSEWMSDTSYYCNNFNDKSRAHVKNLVSHLSTVNPKIGKKTKTKTKMFLHYEYLLNPIESLQVQLVRLRRRGSLLIPR